MLTEGISTKWANWATVVSAVCSLGLVPLTRLIVSYLVRRRELCYRIGEKYYNIIETIRQAGIEASRVEVDDMYALKRTNFLLQSCTRQILQELNTGSPNDLELNEVRTLFSEQAACCITRLRELFIELDREYYEDWNLTNAGKVRSLAYQVQVEWDNLVKIMAKKRWRRVSTLKRGFHERAEAL